MVPQPPLQPYTANLPADALMSFWDQQDLQTEMRGRLQLMHQLYYQSVSLTFMFAFFVVGVCYIDFVMRGTPPPPIRSSECGGL